MTSCLVSRVRHSELATLIRNGWCASMLLIRSQSNDVRPVIHSPSTSPPPVPPPAPKPCRTNVTWDVMAGRGLKPKEQPKATRDVQSLQAALLESALGHVPTLGWSNSAMHQAALDNDLSPAAAGLLGDAPSDLVKAFLARCNFELEEALLEEGPQLELCPLHARIVAALRQRIEMIVPYKASWAGALATLGSPVAAMELYMDAAGIIWRAVGDESEDLTWLAHRTVLSGVLASSELYLLTDNSPGHEDTWAAVDRAVGEALKLLGSSDAVGGALGGLRDKAYATILDVMASRRG
ncbi:COQ9 [Auxenochlorella protothecoides x Auxenochlorella symbiontica]